MSDSTTAASASIPSVPTRSWVLLGFVAVAAVLFVVDRQVMSLLKTTLGDELGITDTQYGWLITAFMVPYTVMYLFTGTWADRWGTRKMSLLCIGTMSLATICTGLSTSFHQLLVWRVVLGVAEAGIMPTAILFVVNWFPKERRATAVSVKSPIGALGQMAAPPLVAFITLSLSWHFAFFIPGVIGIGVAIIWWCLDRTPPDFGEPVIKTKSPGILGLLKMRAIWPLLGVRLLSDPFWFFLLYWHAAFLQERLGFSLEQIGRWAWIPPACGSLGNLGVGLFSDWLVKRGFSLNRARSLPLVLAAALAPLAWLLPFSINPAMAIVLLAGLYLMCSSWLFLTNVFVADLVPRNAVATGVGLLSAMGGATAALFNLGAGTLVEHFGYTPILLGGALLHPAAALVFWRAYGGGRGRAPQPRSSAAS